MPPELRRGKRYEDKKIRYFTHPRTTFLNFAPTARQTSRLVGRPPGQAAGGYNLTKRSIAHS
eukprot:scaffold98044_cov72-Phaeocystis_antarctica.AAC.4